jgi:hypothetical protein
VVAHTPFRKSDTSDGVEFFAMTAKSSLKFQHLDWSIGEFMRQIDEANSVDNELRSMENKMSIQPVAKALIKRSEEGQLPLGLLGGLFAFDKPQADE